MKLPVCRHPKALAYPLLKKSLSRAFATERIYCLRVDNPRRFQTASIDLTAAPIATGWSDPVPGRVFHPAVDQRFSRRAASA
jgi:hypothetical protein